MLYVVPRAFVIHFVVLWLARYSVFVLKVETRQNVEQCASPLVSLDHVIDLHFDTFSCSLYTTISNPNANPNTNSNHIPNPNRNPTVITDPQTGPGDLQTVTVQIQPSPRFVARPESAVEHQSTNSCSDAGG